MIDFEQWLKDNECYIESIDGVGGVGEVRIYREFYAQSHSEKIEESVTFVDYGVTYKRRGRKEISYESWVGNIWYGWEEE